MGHTKVRCRQPIVSEEEHGVERGCGGADAGYSGDGGAANYSGGGGVSGVAAGAVSSSGW